MMYRRDFTGAAIAELTSGLVVAPRPVRVFGRALVTPRAVAWCGPGPYFYSGGADLPQPWPEALAHLRDRASDAAGVGFNACLVNLYRTGADSVAWHSDDEPGMGPVVGSVSVGARRAFKVDTGTIHRFDLGGGDLLVFDGRHRHCVPKTRRRPGARLNLTFRVVG